MSKVERKPGQRKLEVLRTDAAAQALADLDTRVEMIQALIPLTAARARDESQQGNVVGSRSTRRRTEPTTCTPILSRSSRSVATCARAHAVPRAASRSSCINT